jgi:hypothetical protein
MPFEGHDFILRSAEKTVIIDVTFVGWLEQISLPRIRERRSKKASDGSAVLLVNGHSAHATERVQAFAASRNVTLVKLVVHSSHIDQLSDPCVFALFKLRYCRETETKGF